MDKSCEKGKRRQKTGLGRERLEEEKRAGQSFPVLFRRIFQIQEEPLPRFPCLRKDWIKGSIRKERADFDLLRSVVKSEQDLQKRALRLLKKLSGA